MGAAGPAGPELILTTIYLIRISSLAAAFISLYYVDGQYTNQHVINTIQAILAGQCLSCVPIVYWFMKQNKWPNPNWTLVIIEKAKAIICTLIWIGLTFCTIILLGAPLNNLR